MAAHGYTVAQYRDLDMSIENKDVLIVEDIIDSGLTLSHLRENLLSRNPRSLKIITPLDKPGRRKVRLNRIAVQIPMSLSLDTVWILTKSTELSRCLRFEFDSYCDTIENRCKKGGFGI